MSQYPPRHLTETLNVSGSTIRRWSDTFSRHLSPSATTAPRRYTEADVAVLHRVKALSDSGMRIEEIDALLDQPEPLLPTEAPIEPPGAPTLALQPVTALLDTLQAQMATQQQIASTLAGLGDLGDLRNQVQALGERIARLEGQLEQLHRLQDQLDSVGGFTHSHPWTVPTRRP